jgi:predicted nucleic acid-binding protein
VILDTNVFVAAGFKPGSASARILEQVRSGRLRMIWNDETRRETERILSRIPPLGWMRPAHLFREEERYAGKTAPERFDYIRDAEDRKFAALSAAAGAVLITSDSHLLENRDRAAIEVLTPAEYWKRQPRGIPRTLKTTHTIYVAVLVPVYFRHYGPRNFLWFSDLALIGTAPALWREDRRLVSMMALSVLLPELPWNVGFFTRLFTGREMLGLSHYMFDPRKPRWLRALSLFHMWLPPLLLWTVRRLGYDRRALLPQVLAGEAVLAASYLLAPPEENINWVYGPGEKPQKKVSRGLYLSAVMLFFPLCIWWPTHRILKRL